MTAVTRDDGCQQANTRLLKRETAARLVTEWELGIQEQVLGALREVHSGGSTRIVIQHPVPDDGPVAQVRLVVTAVREEGYEADEITAEIIPVSSYAGSNLAWRLTIRTLISLSPQEQGWDRDKDSYTNIAEPGWWASYHDVLPPCPTCKEQYDALPQ
ncbi:MAG TPA: hypothetical protein VF834_25720 [Streptosporangiaceae bacterium]